MRRYNRPDQGSFTYKLILGIFIFGALMFTLVTTLAVVQTRRVELWSVLGAVFAVFFAVTAYCWTDADRYDRYEYIMTPVLFGLLFLLMVFFMVGCVAVLVPEIAAGEDRLMNIIAFILAEASLGTFAYIDYHFFLRDYLVRGKKKPDEKDK